MTGLKTVNFGSGNGGLATVGYALYDNAGNINKARTTSGVHEFGTDTGIYWAFIGLSESADQVILWDTGGVTPRYAVDEHNPYLSLIRNDTDDIRPILNSMRMQGEALNKLIDLARELKTKSSSKIPDYSKEWKSIFELLSEIEKKKYPATEDIKSAIKMAVNAIRIDIPKVEIPDYSKRLEELKTILVRVSNYSQKVIDFGNKLSDIFNEIKTIPKQQKDYTNDLIGLSVKFDSLLSNLENKINSAAKSDDIKKVMMNISSVISQIKIEIDKTRGQLEDSIVNNTKMDKHIKDMITFRKITEELDKVVEQNKLNDNIRLGLGLKG